MANAARRAVKPIRHLLTLADVETADLHSLLASASELKRLTPLKVHQRVPEQATDHFMDKKAVALLFNKRSTRTRIAAEIAVRRLGGIPVVLSPDDIQLGVNESLRDTALVLDQLVQGIFARVGEHAELEEIAKLVSKPVINGLSSLWHPTQVLADLLTIKEIAGGFSKEKTDKRVRLGNRDIPALTVAWVGDSTNVLHDMLVTYPRLGHSLRVATPKDPKYAPPPAVMARVKELGCDKGIVFTHDPKEAVRKADIVMTDTWISMGQEAEKAKRLAAFRGFQVTEELCKGANPNWVFMHCLPRKPEEVSDEVFNGKRSVVFHQAGNRLPTIQAIFANVFRAPQVAEPVFRGTKRTPKEGAGASAPA